MMDVATKYQCRGCGATKFVPERPLDCAKKIKTGCNECQMIQPHNPIGTPYSPNL